MSSARSEFRETWAVQWQPELALHVIDAARYGSTVADAAGARVVELAGALRELGVATSLTERVLLAELPDALPAVTSALDRCAAATSDVLALLLGIPPLVRSLRYGTVRGTPSATLQTVLDSLLERTCANLVLGLTGLDDEGARTALPALEQAHDAVALLEHDAHAASWQGSLLQLAGHETAPGLLVGRANRLVLDASAVDADTVAARLSRALSGPSERAVVWIEGFVQGSAVLLLRDDALFGLLDSWVDGLGEDDFRELVPLLRRAFSRFSKAERRQIGSRAASGASRQVVLSGGGLDLEAGAAVLARVREVLGYA